MKRSVPIVVLILAFWFGFMVGEHQQAKLEERLQRELHYVQLVSSKEKRDANLERALAEAIRQIEKSDEER